MGRIKKIFTRVSGWRDAKFIIIASEGLKTEVKYLEDLSSPQYTNNKRVHVEVLKRETNSSAPNHVMRELDAFKRQYNLNHSDELWMVIDFDRWPIKNLSKIAALCKSKKYELAVSNSCFEIWLLMHHRDLSQCQKKSCKSTCVICKNKNNLCVELKTILGSYNPSNIDTSKFLPFVEKAIKHAEKIDSNPRSRWPHCFGTRVYRLINNILNAT